jgi:hypothetical protein
MERLGLLAPGEQKADATEAELYLFNALLEILEVSDIPAYLTYNDHMVETSVGDASYPLPDDFGRLILPRVRNKRGLYLFDQARTTDLEYLDPNTFHRQTPAPHATPTRFTVTGRTLWLYPAPHANALPNFIVRGTYVMQAVRPDLSDEVILPYPTALVDVALCRIASDAGKQIQALDQTRQESLARLVQGSH